MSSSQAVRGSVPVIFAMAALAALAIAGCGGGNKDVEKPRTDLEPFSEVSSLEIIEKVIAERGLESVRGEDVWVVGHGWWKVDLWIEGLPLVIEYLDDEDRAKLGKSLTSSKVGDHFKLVAVGLEEIGEGVQITSANSRYCVVFDDRDYVFQPNQTSEDRYDVTIFEIQKRLRKDAVDVIEELTRILANQAEELGGGGGDGEGSGNGEGE